jgi:predicted anti-sigma-YlaC factor YlaD
MNHISYEQWMQYVKNELESQVREVYDDHLYNCDQCLELYLQAVSEHESELPVLSSTDTFTNSIMEQVSETKKPLTKKNGPFYQNTLFHYAIATAMTILFMTSGVFQSITQYVDTVKGPSIEERTPSVTEELMNKTFAWMDTFDINNKEANK